MEKHRISLFKYRTRAAQLPLAHRLHFTLQYWKKTRHLCNALHSQLFRVFGQPKQRRGSVAGHCLQLGCCQKTCTATSRRKERGLLRASRHPGTVRCRLAEHSPAKVLLQRSLLTQESGDKTGVRLRYALLQPYKHRLVHSSEQAAVCTLQTPRAPAFIPNGPQQRTPQPHGQRHKRSALEKALNKERLKSLPHVTKEQWSFKCPKYTCFLLNIPPEILTQGCPGVILGQGFLAVVAQLQYFSCNSSNWQCW